MRTVTGAKTTNALRPKVLTALLYFGTVNGVFFYLFWTGGLPKPVTAVIIWPILNLVFAPQALDDGDVHVLPFADWLVHRLLAVAYLVLTYSVFVLLQLIYIHYTTTNTPRDLLPAFILNTVGIGCIGFIVFASKRRLSSDAPATSSDAE